MGLFRYISDWYKENIAIPKDKKVEFTASADLMGEDKFWRMIHAAKIRSNDDFDYLQDELEKDLRELTPDEIILFANRFRFLRGKANTWDLWGVAYIISGSGGCGEKGFGEFREWLIGQGREFYYSTFLYPESIVDFDREKVENIDWEGLGTVPSSVFKELTDQEMPCPFEENQDIIGTEWEEESDDLKNRFLKLYEKYSTDIEMNENDLF
jgi:hypothetical protein